MIRANRDALLSTIQNIVDNAIDASGETPNIVINAFLNNAEQFQIDIEDDGCGMSDEIKERILEPFFTTRSNGTGLGLAVVSATVNRYGGEMQIYSKEGIGSMFTIKFPRAEAAGLLPSNINSVDKNIKHSAMPTDFNTQGLKNKSTEKKHEASVAQEVEL
jgi:two-component system sensor histidine kinase FlrB